MIRLEGKKNLIPLFDHGGWLYPGNKSSISDKNLTLVGISHEEKGFHPSSEDVGPLSGVSFYHFDELGADAKSYLISDRCVGTFLAGDITHG